jgi:DNA-directed RNA polymerase specialized sigma24 family protein
MRRSMSPASLRRYRAERLLREEFLSLRASVIASARGRLRACGAQLDDSDLEACYAQAWQGLYAATLEGQRILNPAGWLAVVTFRRAIDEHRARSRVGLDERAGTGSCAGAGAAPGCRAERAAAHPAERDAATQLHERMQLRHLFEALRLRLSDREQQAAALCYLQGLSRAQAARTMGVSEARMRKLMEGAGVGRPGVAAKVAALAETVRVGEWCEEQGSLMRGLAYGILDPQGERHRLALAHTSACPACRAYVASLRGLAALLPPMPSLLPLLLAAGTGAKAAGAALQAGGAGGALPAPAAVYSGAAGAAGAGAAGGGWLMAGGGLGAKLAAGCLLALGVGASCAVLSSNRGAATVRTLIHSRARVEIASPASARESAAQSVPTGASTPPTAAVGLTPAAAASSGATRATREFGLEQTGAPSGAEGSAAAGAPASAPRPAAARIASAGGELARQAPPPSPGGGEGASTRSASGASPAQREFSPG